MSRSVILTYHIIYLMLNMLVLLTYFNYFSLVLPVIIHR